MSASGSVERIRCRSGYALVERWVSPGVDRWVLLALEPYPGQTEAWLDAADLRYVAEVCAAAAEWIESRGVSLSVPDRDPNPGKGMLARSTTM